MLIVDYIYDTEKEEWCELTLAFPIGRKTVDISNVIRKASEKSVIRCVKNISRAFLIKNNKDENVLTTEGMYHVHCTQYILLLCFAIFQLLVYKKLYSDV